LLGRFFSAGFRFLSSNLNPMMAIYRLRLLVFLVLGLLSLAVISSAEEGKDHHEKKISKKDLPAEVLETFHKNFPNAKIEEIGLETEDERNIYEIEIHDSLGERRAEFSEDGKLKEIQQDIHISALPTVVVKALMENYPGDKVKHVTKITRGEDVRYEIKFSSHGHAYDVYVSQDGRFVPKEDEEGGVEEDD
jgi:hypothetical protein